jgi:hypothetical protein
VFLSVCGPLAADLNEGVNCFWGAKSSWWTGSDMSSPGAKSRQSLSSTNLMRERPRVYAHRHVGFAQTGAQAAS